MCFLAGNAPVDLNVALQRFRLALSNANIAPIVAANPDINAVGASATMTPYVVIFGRTPLDGTTTGVAAGQVPQSATTVVTTTQSSAGNAAVLLLPLAVLVPLMVGPGQ